MPHHPELTVTGTVTHIFAHRFVVETDGKSILADLTPHGRNRITLKTGDRVTIHGEMKPSELKVSQLSRGKETVTIEHGDKHGGKHHAPADPKAALRAARGAGYETVGEPRRKPKHFEVLGRRDGAFEELHIELDGHIRKSKPADPHEPKWQHAGA